MTKAEKQIIYEVQRKIFDALVHVMIFDRNCIPVAMIGVSTNPQAYSIALASDKVSAKMIDGIMADHLCRKEDECFESKTINIGKPYSGN